MILEIAYLKTDEIALWDEFIDASENGTVFHKSWYMQIAGRGYELKYLVAKENKEIIAGIPVCLKKRLNYYFVLSPSLVSRQGVVFARADAKASAYNRNSQKKELSQALAKELRCYAYFLQNFTTEYTDWQPFMWEGYQAEVAYTYVLKNIKDQEQTWNNFSSKLRNTINKAVKLNITIEKGDDVEAFVALYTQTFARQGLEKPVSADILKNLISQALARNSGHLFFAKDQEGKSHSAAFVLLDNKRAYYLLSGSDPQYRSSGSISLLLWEVIKAVSAQVNEFDFEGSNIPNIEYHFRSYAGELTPYFKISKANSKLINFYKKLRA